MKFKKLNLHPNLQKGIDEAGYVTCMPVQEQVLTNALSGQDLYVQSQTGTGKTAAFLIVIFQRLLADPKLAGRKAIIMVPTRELAVQVEEEAKVLAKYLPFKIASFYGGVGYSQQQRQLKDKAQILVGTPGRVLDLNKSGHMNLMDIAFLVLDEADRMFDMGFYPDLRKLIKVVPPAERRQTMLFSATLNARVKNLAWEYTKNPKEIEIEPETITVEEIDQLLYHVPSKEKMKLLLGIMEREKPESAIIFCNTKRYTEIVARRLNENDIKCEFIIGDLPQSKRLKIIKDIKAGKTHFLVATDVAARGLDIDSLAMVVNYDIPNEAENYVHRIGRTARAGKSGKAITLASEQDVYELAAIEKYIGKKIPSKVADDSLYTSDKSQGMKTGTDRYPKRKGEDHRSRGTKSGSRDSSRGDRDSSRDPKRGNREGGRDTKRGSGIDPKRSDRSERRNTDRGSRSNDRDTKSSSRDTKPPSRDNRRDRGGKQEQRPKKPDANVRKEGNTQQPKSNTQQPKSNTQQPKKKRNSSLLLSHSSLSNLTLEERMAYYKKKYENKPTADTGTPKTNSKMAKGKAGKEHTKKNLTKTTKASEKPKQGLLSRLLGVFRKK